MHCAHDVMGEECCLHVNTMLLHHAFEKHVVMHVGVWLFVILNDSFDHVLDVQTCEFVTATGQLKVRMIEQMKSG